MQMMIDIEPQWLETVQKEFAATDAKEAFYRLFEFYQKSKAHFQERLEEIEENDSDFGYIEAARKRREEGEAVYSLDSVLKEFE